MIHAARGRRLRLATKLPYCSHLRLEFGVGRSVPVVPPAVPYVTEAAVRCLMGQQHRGRTSSVWVIWADEDDPYLKAKDGETRTPPVVPQPVPPFNPGEGGYLSAVECDPADDCGTHHVTWVSVALDAELGWGVTSFDLGLTPPVVPQPEGER